MLWAQIKKGKWKGRRLARTIPHEGKLVGVRMAPSIRICRVLGLDAHCRWDYAVCCKCEEARRPDHLKDPKTGVWLTEHKCCHWGPIDEFVERAPHPSAGLAEVVCDEPSNAADAAPGDEGARVAGVGDWSRASREEGAATDARRQWAVAAGANCWSAVSATNPATKTAIAAFVRLGQKFPNVPVDRLLTGLDRKALAIDLQAMAEEEFESALLRLAGLGSAAIIMDAATIRRHAYLVLAAVNASPYRDKHYTQFRRML
jgi:hypothetical protein